MIRVSPQRAVVAVVLLLAASARAQEQKESATTFSGSVDVRVAEVEVLVTDRQGQPVPGLTPADFHVVEDGQPVEVTNLYATSSQPMVLAVFLDDMSLGPAGRLNALNGLRRLFAANLKPGDRVLLVRFTGALELQGEPTADLAVLNEALDRLSKAAPRGAMMLQERNGLVRDILQALPPGEERDNTIAMGRASALMDNMRQYGRRRADEVRATLAALQQTLALLASLPERKALVYIGSGLPMSPAADLFELWHNKYDIFESQLGITPLETADWDSSRVVQDTADRANAAGITIHALALPEAGVTSSAAAGAIGVRPGNDPEDSDRAIRTLAAGTGGRVVTDLQNPGPFLEGVGRDIGAAYVVGYTPGPPGKKARHRIKVTVRNGALLARYREERFDGAGGDPLLRRAMSTLWAGGGANALQAELSIEEQTKEEDGRYRVTAIVSLPLASVLLRPQEHFHVAHLTVAIVARDGKGHITGAPRAEFPIEIPNEKLLSAPGQSAGYRFTMHLSPGESILAVALRDDMSGAESVLRIPLTAGADTAAK
jgi:VWFA-related protein